MANKKLSREEFVKRAIQNVHGSTLTELLKMDFRVGDKQIWGKWQYDAKRLVLVYRDPRNRNWDYEVDLEECYTASEVLDWIAQLSAKTWATREDIGYLVQALDEILLLQNDIVHLPNGIRLNIKSHLKKRTK